MSETAKTPLAPGLYRTPFSRAYWRDAVKELKSIKMLAVAAVLIAIRVVLKTLAIPIALDLKIYIGFFVNALGAMIFGPVVAIPAAFASDALGVFIVGDSYIPLLAIPEVVGSLIFALFLYRAPLTSWRVVLSRFAVSFLVNIVIHTPLLWWSMYKETPLMIFALPRIVKNLVLFPFESLLLLLFLNALRPVTYRMKLSYDPPQKLKITKRLVIFVVVLFLIGAAATGGYYVCEYPSYNVAKDFSEAERADFNRDLAERISADDDELVLVYTIHRSLFSSEREVTYSVYKIDASALTEEEEAALWSKKNSAAKKLDCLTLLEENLVLVLDDG